ncbi:hypothetical protein BGX31_011658, partial [Mortierella sp. GBA43]
TGRKHQLRVHCSQLLNAPILGDIKYGGIGTDDGDEIIGQARIFLHMAELEIKDWFKETPVAASKKEAVQSRASEDGSLIVSIGIPKDMTEKITTLELACARSNVCDNVHTRDNNKALPPLASEGGESERPKGRFKL